MFEVASKVLRSLQYQYGKSEYRGQIFVFKLSETCLCIGQMSGFYEYIANFTDYTDQLEPLYSITMNTDQFSSINHINIINIKMKLARIGCLKSILPQLEVVRVLDSRFEGDFYENFLKHCVKLKRLYLENIDIERRGFRNESGQNHWLRQKYPLLEHLQLTPQTGDKIIELKEFFERNTNIRSFFISSFYLYENWLSLIGVWTNLDILVVDFNSWPRIFLDLICNVLNFLHQSGFYKRLQLNLPSLPNLSVDNAVYLNALHKLRIKLLDPHENVSIFAKVNELIVTKIDKGTNMENFVKNLIELKRVYLRVAKSDDIMAFIRYSPNLKEIHIETIQQGTYSYGRILDISNLNKEREHFKDAQKVEMFVNENVYDMSKLAVDTFEFSCLNVNKINLEVFNQKFEF